MSCRTVPCMATQDGWVIAEISDETWSSRGGNGQPSQYTCRENLINCIKGQKDMTPKDESFRSECVQYGTGEELKRTTNSSRKDEVAGSKQKWCSVVGVSGDKSKIWCCKEQCCIGTWNFRSMNQGKLNVVKQEMVRINIDIFRNQ